MHLNITLTNAFSPDEFFLRMKTDLVDTELLTHDSAQWLRRGPSGIPSKRLASTRELGALVYPAVWGAALASCSYGVNCKGLILERTPFSC